MSRIWWCFGLAGVLMVAAGLMLSRSSAAEPRPVYFGQRAAGDLLAPPPAGGLLAPGPAGGLLAPGPAGGLLAPGPSGGLVASPPAGGLSASPPAAGVLPNEGTFAPPLPHGEIAIAGAPVSLHYTFDGGVGRPITDTDGQYPLEPLGQNGGELRLVPQGAGFAVSYPDRCTLTRERECPRAILQGPRDDSLNPGTRRLEYGASVLMTRSDLSDGANVVQKGYSVGGGSQYKLQVDHLLGHPSCVIAGQRHVIYRAEPRIDVADGRWHSLVCTRSADRLTMTVDGVERASVRVPPALSIANPEPLRVGGKGPAKGNDQFAGEIDNVFVTIS